MEKKQVYLAGDEEGNTYGKITKDSFEEDKAYIIIYPEETITEL